MKWMKRWTKRARNGLCIGILTVFLFQFAALAQDPGTGTDDAAKISPLLLEAFEQTAPQARSMANRAAGASSTVKVPAAIWLEDVDFTPAKAAAAQSSGLLDAAALSAPLTNVQASASMPAADTEPSDDEDNTEGPGKQERQEVCSLFSNIHLRCGLNGCFPRNGKSRWQIPCRRMMYQISITCPPEHIGVCVRIPQL